MVERDLVDALHSTSLSGRQVLSLAIPTTDELAYAVPIDGPEVRAAWVVLRERIDVLGRWPCAICDWSARADGRFEFALGPGEEMHAPGGSVAVLAEARRLKGEQVIAEWHAWSIESADYLRREWPKVVDHELSLTRARVGAAPGADRFLDDSFPRDDTRLEAALLDWEERRRPTTAAEDAGHLGWFEPPGPCAIVLAPAETGEEALAYTGGFFGARPPHGLAGVIALAGAWRTEYGAELVANWGTMLQFSVSQPPTTIGTAFRLAHEQVVLAPCTTIPQGVSLRAHARALLGRTEWFLHERP
jgi:hypothetical protein